MREKKKSIHHYKTNISHFIGSIQFYKTDIGKYILIDIHFKTLLLCKNENKW